MRLLGLGLGLGLLLCLLLTVAGCHVLLPLSSPDDQGLPPLDQGGEFLQADAAEKPRDSNVDGELRDIHTGPHDTAPDLASDQQQRPVPDQHPVPDQQLFPDLPHAGPLKVFVTHNLYSASLGGLGGADALCQQLASNNGISGIWKAWLSDAGASPATRFTRGGPYSRLDSVVVADSWKDLTDGVLTKPILISEKQGTVTQDFAVWTGTKPDGTAEPHTCNGWTAKTGQGARGQLNLVGSWSSMSVASCSAWSHRLYCFEQ